MGCEPAYALDLLAINASQQGRNKALMNPGAAEQAGPDGKPLTDEALAAEQGRLAEALQRLDENIGAAAAGRAAADAAG